MRNFAVLQPASSPYNIAEKVQQANIDLFSNPPTSMEKTSRVTFKEELTSYEPELLTDDDVNSLESDSAIDEIFICNNNQHLEYHKNPNVLDLNIFDINEEEEVDEIVEEVDLEENEFFTQIDNNPNVQTQDFIAANSEKNIVGIRQHSNINENSVKSSLHKKSRIKSPFYSPNILVECKNHCIERLDFDLSMSIKRLEIQEKPIKCPLLKLQRRKCCDDNRSKNRVNLPCYNGHHSEYGLSSEELQKRERRVELIKLKEQKRKELIREYKNRRNQQNEQVFCQWLKEVAQRKALKQASGNSSKQCFSPNIISFPTKSTEKVERPRTANEFVPRQNIKKTKRPRTSPACVFIEVPRKMLEKGIHIGDLLVANNNFAAKKMHILTVAS